MNLQEERFRLSMKTLREELGISQTELAALMKERDFPFHQQTVQRAESGDRPLRLGEAYAIADILKSSVPAMSLGVQDPRMYIATREVAENADRVRDAVNTFELSRLELALELDSPSGQELPANDYDEISNWLSVTGERIAGGAVARFGPLVAEPTIAEASSFGRTSGKAMARFRASIAKPLERSADGERQATT